MFLDMSFLSHIYISHTKKYNLGLFKLLVELNLIFCNINGRQSPSHPKHQNYGTSKHPQHDVKICVPFECPDTINVVFL